MTLPTERALSIREAAELAGIAAGSLRNRLAVGLGPESFHVGRRRLIRAADLLAWIESKPEPVRKQLAARSDATTSDACSIVGHANAALEAATEVA